MVTWFEQPWEEDIWTTELVKKQGLQNVFHPAKCYVILNIQNTIICILIYFFNERKKHIKKQKPSAHIHDVSDVILI